MIPVHFLHHQIQGGYQTIIDHIASLLFIGVLLTGLYLQHYQLIGICVVLSIANAVMALYKAAYIQGLVISIFAIGMFINIWQLKKQQDAIEEAEKAAQKPVIKEEVGKSKRKSKRSKKDGKVTSSTSQGVADPNGTNVTGEQTSKVD